MSEISVRTGSCYDKIVQRQNFISDIQNTNSEITHSAHAYSELQSASETTRHDSVLVY